jgi:hypothetical protein
VILITTHDQDARRAAEPGAPEPAFLTAEEAAAYMNLPVAAFLSLAAHPDLRPIRVQDHYLYRTEAVKLFLANMENGEDTAGK